MRQQATVGARHAVPLRLSISATRLIRAARLAHLATADADGRPHVIPICFVYDGSEFYSPIDEKPKQAAPRDLKRVRNIRENHRVALVVDRYDEDWHKLAHVLILGQGRVLFTGGKHAKAVRLLRRKYPQYRKMALEKRPLIVIAPKRVISWGQL